MSCTPGTIKEVVEVNLAYPRIMGDLKNSASFNWLVHRVWKSLHNSDDGVSREGYYQI
jgi:hypothetical protein